MRPSIARLAAAMVLAAHEIPRPHKMAARARAQRLLAALVAAYPDFLGRRRRQRPRLEGRHAHALRRRQGHKTFEAMLDAPDLEDMFYAPYPLGRSSTPPAFNIDPGRVRFQPFFDKMYGDCTKGEVARKLVGVVWLPSKWRSAPQGHPRQRRGREAAGRLQRAGRAARRSRNILKPVGRHLQLPRGSRHQPRLRARAGIAIDIATAHSDYWLWTKPRPTALPLHEPHPRGDRRDFEKHGFIWGGKWYHYDTMHFEYRPELIVSSMP